MGLIISWFILALAVWATAMVLPGFKVKGFKGALIVALVFGLLNWVLGWLLFVVIGVATLGLGFLFAFITRWIVDAILLKMTDSMVDSIKIKSFGWAMAGAFIMSLIGTMAEYLIAGHYRPYAF
jgi:putative membrane protein